MNSRIRFAAAIVAAIMMTIASAPLGAGEIIECGPIPPEVCGLLPIVLGDETIGSGDDRRYENKNLTAMGRIEVEDGGNLEFENSTLDFAASSDGIRVHAGGRLLIVNTTLDGPVGDNGRRLVRVEAGATLIVDRSVFSSLTLEVAANDSEVARTTFQSSALAVHLLFVTFSLSDSNFRGNDVGVNISNGSPTLFGSVFRDDITDVQVWRADPTLRANTMTRAVTGVDARESSGTYEDNAMSDKSEPPTHGFDFKDCVGTPTVRANDLRDWGTAIRLENCSAVLDGNTFANNGQNVVTV